MNDVSSTEKRYLYIPEHTPILRDGRNEIKEQKRELRSTGASKTQWEKLPAGKGEVTYQEKK